MTKKISILFLFFIFILNMNTTFLFAKTTELNKKNGIENWYSLYYNYLSNHLGSYNNLNLDKFLFYDIDINGTPELVCSFSLKENLEVGEIFNYDLILYIVDGNVLEHPIYNENKNNYHYILDHGGNIILVERSFDYLQNYDALYYSIQLLENNLKLTEIAKISIENANLYKYIFQEKDVTKEIFLESLNYKTEINFNDNKYNIFPSDDIIELKNFNNCNELYTKEEFNYIYSNPVISFDMYNKYYDVNNNLVEKEYTEIMYGNQYLSFSDKYNPNFLIINGNFIIEPNIFRENSDIYFPLRIICEKTMNKITWNSQENMIEIFSKNKSIMISMNNKISIVNNEVLEFDYFEKNVRVVDDKTYVTPNFICNYLDINYEEKKLFFDMNCFILEENFCDLKYLSEEDTRVILLENNLNLNLFNKSTFGRYYLFEKNNDTSLFPKYYFINKYNGDIFESHISTKTGIKKYFSK